MAETKYREMTIEETELFIKLRLGKDADIDSLYKEIAKTCWQLEAIEKHTQAFEISLDKRVQILIAAINDFAIGKIVNLAFLIFQAKNPNHEKTIKLH